ncbi:hypothetical protein [Umezawaea sp. Da 62-37]|uniref:hypothetical protein n=1 Tax=Umezawaea sp. Da 62-37 TaxID=3075927 RepID=UPI0028F6CAF2|nr:hypothetical protein [Umezawaea sp. Da 62-37]WNV85680.1 hypothetical protein RM788_47450 [Umezawaea sp. Da 62-37]
MTYSRARPEPGTSVITYPMVIPRPPRRQLVDVGLQRRGLAVQLGHEVRADRGLLPIRKGRASWMSRVDSPEAGSARI